MTTAGLDDIYSYLAVLIVERASADPLLVKQVMPALNYKFPDFTFQQYGLQNLRDFILTGEKAGYFKVVNMGSPDSAYLSIGTKRFTRATAVSVEQMAENDPRRRRWMMATLERMLLADRADQILDAIHGANWKDPAFDQFLANEQNNAATYPTRGKIKRMREFLRLLQSHGEAEAISNWQPSRLMLRIPFLPSNLIEAIKTQDTLWSILQGSTRLHDVSLDQLGNLFLAVLLYSRQQLERSRSYDWIEGMHMLEQEVRGLPRPDPTQKRSGLFGGSGNTKMFEQVTLNEATINQLLANIRKEAGIRATQSDPTITYRGFVDTQGASDSIGFLERHPALVQNDDLLLWLDGQINQEVEQNHLDVVRNLAMKSAIVLAARQYGLTDLRARNSDMKRIHGEVVQSVDLLNRMFGYFKFPSANTLESLQYLEQHPDLLDETTIGPIMDDYLIRVAREGNLNKYRHVSNRVGLYNRVIGLGLDEAIEQYKLLDNDQRTDRMLQAEVGVTLLTLTDDVVEQYDILERYPLTGTEEGVNLIEGMLHNMSFRGVDEEIINRYQNVHHLLERCVKVGIDRALSEMRQD